MKRKIRRFGYGMLMGHPNGDDPEIIGHISQSSTNRSGSKV